jgi:hypothetical protein
MREQVATGHRHWHACLHKPSLTPTLSWREIGPETVSAVPAIQVEAFAQRL